MLRGCLKTIKDLGSKFNQVPVRQINRCVLANRYLPALAITVQMGAVRTAISMCTNIADVPTSFFFLDHLGVNSRDSRVWNDNVTVTAADRQVVFV